MSNVITTIDGVGMGGRGFMEKITVKSVSKRRKLTGKNSNGIH